MTEQELKNIEIVIADLSEESTERVFMTIQSSMDSIRVCSNYIESTIIGGSLSGLTDLTNIAVVKGVNTKLMPYKNSLDTLYKSFYDLKLKVLDDMKEIQEIQASSNV